MIARKLLDLQLITQADYNAKRNNWIVQPVNNASPSKGDYYNTQNIYLGQRYIEAVFRHCYQNQMSLKQTADYMGVKTKYVAQMVERMLRRGART